MQTIYERVGALDVHRAQVTACVRVPDDGGRREPHLAGVSTTVTGLMGLRDWLAAATPGTSSRSRAARLISLTRSGSVS